MSNFSERLANLVNVERMAADAACDAGRIADMLERLAHVTGFTIALQPDDCRAWLSEGVCALIYETATGGAAIISKTEGP